MGKQKKVKSKTVKVKVTGKDMKEETDNNNKDNNKMEKQEEGIVVREVIVGMRCIL